MQIMALRLVQLQTDAAAQAVELSRYSIMGDGCNMEGVTNEAASLAGHWGLGKLIVFYDDNKVGCCPQAAPEQHLLQTLACRLLGCHSLMLRNGLVRL